MASRTRPLILVTNDDGIASPGLRAAALAVHDLGEVWVVAPKVQQTGMARSLPASDGIVLSERIEGLADHVQVLTLSTSPAGVVLHALAALLPRTPDLAISGINYGENLGSGITTSGTVGAALEAASWGVPSLAISLETDLEYHYSHSPDVDFDTAAMWVRRLALAVLEDGLPEQVDILKVDVPSDAKADTPWRPTRVSRQRYFFPTRGDPNDDGPGEKLGYEVRVDLATLEPDSDIHAVVQDRVVSVSPLTIDLTAHGSCDALQRIVDRSSQKER